MAMVVDDNVCPAKVIRLPLSRTMEKPVTIMVNM